MARVSVYLTLSVGPMVIENVLVHVGEQKHWMLDGQPVSVSVREVVLEAGVFPQGGVKNDQK